MKVVLCFLLMLFSFINFLYCLKKYKIIREYGLKCGGNRPAAHSAGSAH